MKKREKHVKILPISNDIAMILIMPYLQLIAYTYVQYQKTELVGLKVGKLTIGAELAGLKVGRLTIGAEMSSFGSLVCTLYVCQTLTAGRRGLGWSKLASSKRSWRLGDRVDMFQKKSSDLAD